MMINNLIKVNIIKRLLSRLGYEKICCFFIRKKEPYIIRYEWNRKHKQIPYVRRDKKAFFMCIVPAAYDNEKIVSSLKKEIMDYEKRFPKHKIIFLCNFPDQLKLFRRLNITSILSNHNAFLDERIFRILPEIKKDFDAIYDAKISRVKRYELASKIKSLCFIYYFDEKDKRYAREIHNLFKGATWFNGEIDNYHRLKAIKLPYYINKARIGLCLSKSEGAMYSSCQYLLCGLPVVSTKSGGGRDVFFDKDFVEIVEDNPNSVKKGVDKLIKKDIDPKIVREKTLKKIWDHRERFIEIIQKIYNKEGINKNFKKEFKRNFLNKMCYWHLVKVRKR